MSSGQGRSVGNSWSFLGQVVVEVCLRTNVPEVVQVGDRHLADSIPASGPSTLLAMDREAATGSERGEWSDLTRAQSAVVLVGEVARDHQRIDALLSSNVIVILLPSLQTPDSLLPGEDRTRAAVSPTPSAGGLRIDVTKHRVLWGPRELPVSDRELAMLATLSAEPGRARTFAELDEPEGGKWLGDTERVHSAVKRLRKKLADAGSDARIESVRGYGFRLVTGASDPPEIISGGSGGPSRLVTPLRDSRLSQQARTNPKKWRPSSVLQAVSPLGILGRVGGFLPRIPLHAHQS
ncbi:MAG: winged helix-turn-helix domain-containing protein [Acidimicrobiia bacterium]